MVDGPTKTPPSGPSTINYQPSTNERHRSASSGEGGEPAADRLGAERVQLPLAEHAAPALWPGEGDARGLGRGDLAEWPEPAGGKRPGESAFGNGLCRCFDARAQAAD